MYIPPAFAAPGDAAVLALLREVVLAQTVWSDAAGALQATPLPWLVREGEPPLRLQAHLPRANPLVDWLRGAAGRAPDLATAIVS